MKRKAFLLGNTNGLSGVQTDLVKLERFLCSDFGGAWAPTEVESKYNMSRVGLLTKLAQIKEERNDYVIVLYSGHAGQLRETTFEINSEGERVEESRFKGLASRQLNIFDCCRAYPERTILEERSLEAFFSSVRKSVNLDIRQRYERRIMEAIPQQSTIYSCSIGECSYDTKEGAIYLSNLLKSAMNFGSGFKLVSTAHQETETPTYLYSLSQDHGPQNPDHDLPKCLSGQQLVISMK